MLNNLIIFIQNYFTINPDGLFILGAGVINLSIGLLILLNGLKSKIYQSFFLLSINVSAWLFFYALFQMSSSEAEAYRWLQWAHLFGVPFISPSVYAFSVRWTGQEKNQKHWIRLGYILASITSLFHFVFVKDIYWIGIHSWGYFDHLRKTPLAIAHFTILQAIFFCFALPSFVNFYRAWKRAVSPTKKVQYRNVLIGVLIGYTGSMDFLPVLGIDIKPLGYISATLFILMVAYTILRYQLLEINLLLRKVSLLFFIYSFLFAILIPLLLLAISQIGKGLSGHPLSYILITGIVSGGFFSLGPWIYAHMTQQNFWMKTRESMGLAHELKSPVGNILLTTDTMLHDVGRMAKNPEKLSAYLSMIQNNAIRLETFAQNLLKVAKIQEGNISIEKITFDLSQTIQQEANQIRPVLDGRGINLSIDVHPGIQLEGDQEKMRQVISNLLSNSCKFTRTGTIELTLKRHLNEIIGSVKDEGMGISQSEIGKIFDRFYQGKNANKGSGIGLTIAKAWIEAHDGKIWAESDGEGKGMKVMFTVPVI